MKKFTKLLSVFLIAGAVGTGVAGISACGKTETPEEHTHTAATDWQKDDTNHWHNCTDTTCTEQLDKAAHVYENDQDTDCNTCGYIRTVTPPAHTHTAATEWKKDADKHWHECTANDGAKLDEAAHVYENDQDTDCNTCGYTRTVTPAPVEGFVVDATTSGLQVEGVTTTYNLSTTLTSATVDLTNIKVYLDNQGTKGKEVPAANYTVELYDGTTKLTEMSGLKKNGTYTLLVTLKDAKNPDGTAVAEDSISAQVTITVNNAYTAIALKSGTTTFNQGTAASTADWVIEATRANGDKEELAAANVVIGTMDTNTAGDKSVAITIKDTNVTANVSYTVNADQTKVNQAFAMNFGYLTAEQITAVSNGQIVSLQGGRFEFQSKSGGSIDNHNRTFDGKTFVKRLKVNGASTAGGAPRYIKVHADGSGSITVIAYNNSTSTGRHVALYGSRTAGTPAVGDVAATGDTYANLIGEAVEVPPKGSDSNVHKSIRFDIPAAGDYYITCDASMTFCYVELNQLVSAADGAQEITLSGEDVVSKVEVTAPDTVTNFKVNETFNHNGYTVKATSVNNVTCVASEKDVTADAEFVTPDMTTIGEKTVTVNYGGASTTYKVIVETAVAGIYGAKAKLSTSLDTFVPTADAKVTVTKDDIIVELVGENAEATKEYTVTYNDVEITTGTEFTKGEYELVVTVTVKAGAQEDQIVCKIALKIEQESTSSTESWLYQTVNPTIDATNPNVAKDEIIVSNSAFTATALDAAKSGYNRDATNFAAKITDSGNAPKAAADSTMSGAEMTFTNALAFDTKAGTGTNYIQVVANKAITVYVYMNASDDKHGSNRAGAAITYTVNGTAGTDIAVSARKSVSVVKVTLAQGDTLVVGAKQGTTSSDPRIWFYGIEAKNA